MNKVTFIAEIGVNHMGSFDKAKHMIDLAKDAGAQLVKFQKYNPVRVLGKDSPYLKDAHQLSWKELYDLAAYTTKIGLKFGCSVFDVNDIPIVDKISDYHKIASRMNRNAEFISKIEACKKLTYMSIQPEMSIRIPERFKLLWCVRNYPTTITEIQQYPYNKQFGLSSHCPDINAIKYVIQQGATVVEAHVCESREEQGCDISSSLTFKELKEVAQMGISDAVPLPVQQVR